MAVVVPPPPSVTAEAPASLYIGDTISGRSLSHGHDYVNLNSPQDALCPIQKVNETPVHGNLFVKNLSNSIDNARLHEIFSKFGNILSYKVAIDSAGKSKGYGFVQFDSAVSSNAAINNFNGTTLDDKIIYVANFVKKRDREVKYTNLYMKNFDQDITEEGLKEKFLKFGSITSLVVIKDENGNSRGFGFVNFNNPDDAKRARQAMHGTQLGSKVLYVARARKKAEREKFFRRQYEERRRMFKGLNVYIKNIDDCVEDDDLLELFSQCGRISSVKVMRNEEKGTSKGFGFVCFSTCEEANRAVSTLHGYMFHGKPLYVAIAQRKEERQAQLRLQFAQRLAGLGYPPPLYYGPPSGVVSPLTPRQVLMYQPCGMTPGWSSCWFVSPCRPASLTALEMLTLRRVLAAASPQQQRQILGRLLYHLVVKVMRDLGIGCGDAYIK